MKNERISKILNKASTLDPLHLQPLLQHLVKEWKLLETIFNALREGILVVDRKGQIEYANRSARSLIQIPEKTEKNVFVWQCIPDLRSLFPTYFENEAQILSREIEISYPEQRYLRLYMVPFAEDSDRVVLLLNDITSSFLSIEERLDNEKRSSLFLLAAGVAHEIGNPLNALQIHLHLLQNHYLQNLSSSEKIKKSFDICLQEIKRLKSLSQNFLDAFQPKPLHREPSSLLEVLQSVLTLLNYEFTNHGISAELVLENEELPTFSFDRNQMQQVFFNICKNSIEAMSSGGILRIHTQKTENDFFIHFSDNGQGMDSDTLLNAATPFFSSKAKGHGLGMLIVQHILHEHGYFLNLDSKEGKGTVVTIQFPLQNQRIRMLR